MKLYYIGTGAADWTELAGPRDGIMRRFSAAILDEQLLIDLAPATPMSYFEKGGVGEEVTYVLYTHSHNDHYGSEALLNLCEKGKVTVLCHFTARLPEHPNLTSIQAKVGEEVHLGKYSITPVRANHRVAQCPEEQPMHYIISDGVSKIFWGTDGAWLYCDTWQILLKKAPYDRIVMDGTLGEDAGDWRIFEHNNLPMIRLMRDTMVKKHVLKPEGQIWLTHLARDAHETPMVMAEHVKEDHLFVAFDDLEDNF